MSDPCRLLEWDSRFFGIRIASVQGEPSTAAELHSAVSWAKEHAIDCLYYLASPALELGYAAATLGFFPTDVRMTLACPLSDSDSNTPGGIRPAALEDLPRLRQIAATSHRDTRFYFDPSFSHQRCDELYAEWIEGSLKRGLAQAVLVKADEHGALGYVTCSARPDGMGTIGLFAVADEWRNRGYGRELLEAAKAWFVKRGLTRCSVVTQGRNAAALQAYEKLGFNTFSVQSWFHAWPKTGLVRSAAGPV